MAAAAHVTPFAGSWYPVEPGRLSGLLDEKFESSEGRTGSYLAPAPLAFVVPHAGIAYSGTVAAAAYRHIQAARPERVVILGFAHHGSDPGVWIPNLAAYRSPLGETAVDRATVSALLARGYGRCSEAELCDHSVEIQLPFLQRAAPQASIVPIYVGHLDTAARTRAAEALAGLCGPGTVLIASSDFTHYGHAFQFQPFPLNWETGDQIRRLDERVIEDAGSLREDLFRQTLAATSATVCGRAPIALLLATLRLTQGQEEVFQDTLDYQPSGEITGGFEHSVSYAALGYFPYRSFLLNQEEQAWLLESARKTIDGYVATGERRPVMPESCTPALDRHAGVFVTLEKDGELRGCVGRRSGPEPLSQAVPMLALAAATEDSRFDPVGREERGLDIEISVLSPFKRIVDQTDFHVNVHGALLETAERRGLLLPQVATRRGWRADQFFAALARKSQVDHKVYDDPDTRIFVFRAQIFS
jgi:MEMO1 family protein